MQSSVPKPDDVRDRDLMVSASRGCEASLTELVLRYQTVLLNLFRRLGAELHEAEDAVQETFLRLHRYRRRYKPTASFRTFLFTVGRRAWLDLCRSRERRGRRETPESDFGGMAGAAERLSRDEKLDLGAALALLPDGQRMVLVFSIFGGLRYEEIAEVMNIPEGTVKSRVFHALRKLRGILARDSVA